MSIESLFSSDFNEAQSHLKSDTKNDTKIIEKTSNKDEIHDKPDSKKVYILIDIIGEDKFTADSMDSKVREH